MIMQDKLEKERNDAKNNVEEYVYEMRDKLHGMLEKFVSESVSMAALVTEINNKVCGYIQLHIWDPFAYCEITFLLLGS